MKKYIISGIFGLLIVLLSIPFGDIPVIGHFLNPFTGFVQNAAVELTSDEVKIPLHSISQMVEVHFDTSGIPHIFAKNDQDMYFVQGYIAASQRLWQIEMQGRSGMGELSEIVGEKALENDKLMRRLRLPDAAQQLINQSKKDGSFAILEQYTAGVNAYIDQLETKNYPLEYKLMNFKPRHFKPIYTALLLKLMALRLTAMEADIENTNFVNKYGKALFDQLYPNFYAEDAPIIPKGTKFSKNEKIDTFSMRKIAKITFAHKVLEQMDRNLGSNNWAINSSKSSTGNAILCNDPHLKIHLPSIWYEMHLVSNAQNVYGVTMPGAPGIVIGFNNHIAWGVTNAGRDVRNWYQIKYKDAAKDEIWVDSSYQKINKVTERFFVKNKGWVIDTVRMSSFGPIIYDEHFSKKSEPMHLALGWTNYNTSNEILTFLNLNKAKNYADFSNAIKTFYCPGQNFVFASTKGDIAIAQQGLFPNTPKDQDKFIMDGTKSSYKMQQFIPIEDNPKCYNPSQGYLFSANQHPTDATYPYYYSSGDFENYRNRRLDKLLKNNNLWTAEQMKSVQSDNYSLMASEFLPLCQKEIDPKDTLLALFATWDFRFEQNSREATLFELWYKRIETNVWDELRDSNAIMEYPKPFILYGLLKNIPNHPFFDIKSTAKNETAHEIITLSWEEAKKEFLQSTNTTWWQYKDTEIPHLTNLPALGRYHIQTGGNKHIVNATWRNWAPSWRMIVELNKNRPYAWVNFPGGNSGHPASLFYDNFINSWAIFQYRKVFLTYKPSEIEISNSLYFIPK